eukprot:gene3690-6504_t
MSEQEEVPIEQNQENNQEETKTQENSTEKIKQPENIQQPTEQNKSTVKSNLREHNHKKIENLFENVSELVKGEMQVGLNELELLEKMNFAVGSKYENMAERTSQVKKNLTNLKEEYEKIEPFFQQIDEIEKSTCIQKI